jgi:hypothetical protein
MHPCHRIIARDQREVGLGKGDDRIDSRLAFAAAAARENDEAITDLRTTPN